MQKNLRLQHGNRLYQLSSFPIFKSGLFKLACTWESPRHLVNNADSESGLRWSLRFYLSNRLPGDADSFRPGVSWDPTQYHYWILFKVLIPFWLKYWFCREEGEWFFLYPFEFLAETSCSKNTDEQQKNGYLVTCMPHVFMGNAQDNWVTPWDGPSHQFKYYLQLKNKERC